MIYQSMLLKWASIVAYTLYFASELCELTRSAKVT